MKEDNINIAFLSFSTAGSAQHKMVDDVNGLRKTFQDLLDMNNIKNINIVS